MQVKQDRVMRVLPLENEAINECWLSDKDRFSYEGLNCAGPPDAADAAAATASWRRSTGRSALRARRGRAARTRRRARLAARDARGAVPARASSAAADFRLRQSDFSADGKRAGIPWLGMKIAELGELDRVLVVGSFLRKDHPLIAQRLRQAAKRGAQIHVLHSVDDDWLMPVASKAIVAPAAIAGGHRRVQGQALPARKNAAVLLGNFAQQHPQAAPIHAARAGARREARLPRRGGELRRRLRRRAATQAAAMPRSARRRRRCCCSTSSRSSIAPTRGARGERRRSSSP